MSEAPDRREIPNVRSLRIHLSRGDGPRRLCKLVFDRNDSSVYVLPTESGGPYFFGEQRWPRRAKSLTFPWDTQHKTDQLPKLSIHHDGRVHIRGLQAGKPVQAGPLYLAPLGLLRGQHIASVVADSFEALPSYKRAVSLEGPDVDVVGDMPEGVDSARVLLYFNGKEPTFAGDHRPQQIATIVRSNMLAPLHVGVLTIPQEPLGDDPERPGVSVIVDEGRKFLFLRCT